MLRVISQDKMLESNGGRKVPVYEYDNRGYLCYRGEAEAPVIRGTGGNLYIVSKVAGRWITNFDPFYGSNGLK